MGATWTCTVCGADVLGSYCTDECEERRAFNQANEDLASLRAANARLVEALEEAERALEIARDCTSRPTIYNEAEAALAALRRARGERHE